VLNSISAQPRSASIEAERQNV